MHKATHHFDLVNWRLADVPTRVYAAVGWSSTARQRRRPAGLGARTPLQPRHDPDDPFRLDLAADPQLKGLYLDAESVRRLPA